MSTTTVRADRILAVDALRGLVILLLVPNIYGGWSFYEMAAREPQSALWHALAQQLTHVAWAGMALWDLVMPAFVLLVGVSMALSLDRRRAGGAAPRDLLAAALLRSASLFVLGLLLQMHHDSVALELLPYLVLATGLPWSRWAASWSGAVSARRDRWLDLWLPAAIVAGLAGWLALHPQRLGDYDFTQILTQLGLAYLPAMLLMGRGLRAPLIAAAAILAAWGAAFALYNAPPGVVPANPAWTGWFSHWNNGSNVAAAFDRWWLNQLPRVSPYLGNDHGYHTLQFVPLVANMLIGVAVGRWMTQRRPQMAGRLAGAAAAALVAGGALAVLVFPLLKSLWTPSWALVSSALCVLALAGLSGLFDAAPRAGALLKPLTALGTNAVLLYVMSSVHRWRIVQYGERLLGDAITASPCRPLLQSLLVLSVLWALALMLDRARVHVRL